jgi:hypothetical protein
VDYLHAHNQKYSAWIALSIIFSHDLNSYYFLVLMNDPGVAYLPGQGYGAFDRGAADDVFLKQANGSVALGVVWPGKCLLVAF